MTVLDLTGRRKTLIGGIQLDKLRLQSKSLRKISFISIILCVSTIFFILAIQKRLPPVVPLYYGRAEGEEQLADSILLISPSLICLGIILANRVISIFLKNEFLRETLTLTSLATAILSAITTVKIVLLIGNF